MHSEGNDSREIKDDELSYHIIQQDTLLNSTTNQLELYSSRLTSYDIPSALGADHSTEVHDDFSTSPQFSSKSIGTYNEVLETLWKTKSAASTSIKSESRKKRKTSKLEPDQVLYCLCGYGDGDMIGCDGDKCPANNWYV